MDLLGTLAKASRDSVEKGKSVRKYNDGFGPVFIVQMPAQTSSPGMDFAAAWTDLSDFAVTWRDLKSNRLDSEEIAVLSAKTFVYVAADVVFGAELDSFMKDVHYLKRTSRVPSAVFLESSGSAEGMYRTNVAVIINSDSAAGCIRRWSRLPK